MLLYTRIYAIHSSECTIEKSRKKVSEITVYELPSKGSAAVQKKKKKFPTHTAKIPLSKDFSKYRISVQLWGVIMQLLIKCQYLNFLINMFFTQFLSTFSQSVIKFNGTLDCPNSLILKLKNYCNKLQQSI